MNRLSGILLLAVLMYCCNPALAQKKAAGFEDLSSAAERARSENRDDDAIPLYKRALAIKPGWKEGQWYLGTLLYEKDQYLQAEEVLRRFVAQDANAGPAWALLGLSEFETREYPRALEHSRRAMALGMGDRESMKQMVFYHVAILFTRLEEYDDGMNMLVRMVGSSPDPKSLVEAAGLAGLRMPLLPTEVPADEHDLIRLAGEAVLATQNGENTEAKFKQMVSTYGNEPGVHFLYGSYLMPIRPDDAVQELKRELVISPHHVLARVRIAEHLLQEQKLDDAISLAQEAVKLGPKVASGHMILGESLIAKGSVPEGIKELEKARDLDSSVLRIHWDLLRAYTNSQRTEDAKHEKTEIEKLMQAEQAKPSQTSD